MEKYSILCIPLYKKNNDVANNSNEKPQNAFDTNPEIAIAIPDAIIDERIRAPGIYTKFLAVRFFDILVVLNVDLSNSLTSISSCFSSSRIWFARLVLSVDVIFLPILSSFGLVNFSAF